MSRQGLVPFAKVLQLAEEHGLCAPAFDWGFGRPGFFEAILDAAAELDAPVTFLVWAGSGRRYGFSALAEMIATAASRIGTKAALHLDHADTESDIFAAIEAGFDSVMFDGSELSYEENVAKTATLAAEVHSRGALLEASLGGLSREGVSDQTCSLTDPALAGRFACQTGVDLLAPSVGNRHACRGFTVPLDWDLINRIRSETQVPLALHGGSGVALEDVVRAASLGFRKLNLVTKLQCAYDEAFRTAAGTGGDWNKWCSAGGSAVKAIVRVYLDGLGWTGLAKKL